MIITTELDKKEKEAAQLYSNPPTASGSCNPHPPPPFQNHDPTEHDHLLDFEQGPPPEFAPYEAKHFEVGYRDVVSHDPHLNSDGEALYRFLLAQSESPPTLRIQCKGTHSEMRQRLVTGRDANGRSRSGTETYTENVTDFDFCIDIYPEHLAPTNPFVAPASIPSGISRSASSGSGPGAGSGFKPVHWSVADDEPAYRGRMVREYEEPARGLVGAAGMRRRATRKEAKAYKRWVERRSKLGFPPWMREADEVGGMDGSMFSPKDSLMSSKTLREWADEYCASPKYLKEFVYKKVLYGWNMLQIENTMHATIQAAPYSGNIEIDFTPYNSKIYIRPDNRVSRMLSNKWLKVLSIVLFIFPFIWLFKRFHPRGGGRWEVCGGAYPMKQWVPLEPGEEEETIPPEDPNESYPAPPYNPYNGEPVARYVGGPGSMQSRGSRRSARYMHTASGTKKLVGLKEGEWYRGWEGVITRAVIGRYQSPNPLPSRSRSSLPASSLDGYDEAPMLIEY